MNQTGIHEICSLLKQERDFLIAQKISQFSQNEQEKVTQSLKTTYGNYLDRIRDFPKAEKIEQVADDYVLKSSTLINGHTSQIVTQFTNELSLQIANITIKESEIKQEDILSIIKACEELSEEYNYANKTVENELQETQKHIERFKSQMNQEIGELQFISDGGAFSYLRKDSLIRQFKETIKAIRTVIINKLRITEYEAIQQSTANLTTILIQNVERLITVKADKKDIEELKAQLVGQTAFQQELLKRLERIETKIDRVIEILQNLQTEFQYIKSEQRDVEEKLVLLEHTLQKRLSDLHVNDDLHIFQRIAENAILHWDLLDNLSKESLPLAEFLMSKLKHISDVDYSPAVLQYCKTLENELLKKICVGFTEFMCQRHESDIDEFLLTDLSYKPTKTFAKLIQQQEYNKYYFGFIFSVLENVKKEKFIQQSPLLQEFKAYLYQNFDAKLLEDFLIELRHVKNTFRNKAAHPHKLNEFTANECKRRIPYDIEQLLSYIKVR